MEMDMSEPGEMCCGCEGEHDPAKMEILLQSKTKRQAAVSRIIISDRSIDHSS